MQRAAVSGVRRYQRRSPETGVLYQVLHEHLASFVAAAKDGSDGLPAFVQKELRSYLSCGVLAHGFARFKCGDCPFERWVPLSCKGRGFCPSCGGKRMTGLAAELLDGVIPFVPVRQFVLSMPHRLRYLLAYDHNRCTAALRIFIRALLSFYRHRARKVGVYEGRTGTVTFIQRFGSAANLNIHFHVVALDGVFTETQAGKLAFHTAPSPSDDELQHLVHSTRIRVQRHLLRCGLSHGGAEAADDPVSVASAVLASCYAGSVQGRQTLGGRQGAKLRRVGADPRARWRDMKRALHVHDEGFDLDCSRALQAQRPDMRERLENLLRYCARPPISDERLSRTASGEVCLRLKTPWYDGTTHILYEPLDFIAKLAALIPRPQKNLVIYHGVLAGNAAWRKHVVAYGRPACAPEHALDAGHAHVRARQLPRHLRGQWAELMRRGFQLDVLACPACGGRLRLLAVIMNRSTVRKLLGHANMPTEPPDHAPARVAGMPAPFDDVA
ncbi:MAG TPA: transposase [Polyangiales bacterium]|nr:transposase [Polyangiales bacterium]